MRKMAKSMQHCLRSSLFNLSTVLLIAFWWISMAEGHSETKWTPHTSAAVRYYDKMPAVSPDGQRIFVKRTFADMTSDKVVDELLVYETATILSALRSGTTSVVPCAHKLVREFAGEDTINNRYAAGIGLPEWEDDSRIISFRSSDERNTLQYFAFDAFTGRTEQLTYINGNSIIPRRTTLRAIIALRQREGNPKDRTFSYPVQRISAQDVNDSLAQSGDKESTTVVTFQNHRVVEIPETWIVGGIATAAPDGVSFVTKLGVKHQTGSSWAKYDNYESARRAGIQQFYGVDSASGTALPLFDAPVGTVTNAGAYLAEAEGLSPTAFSVSEKHYIIVNTAVPINTDRDEALRMAYIVAIDLGAKHWEVLEPVETRLSDGQVSYVCEAGWVEPGEKFLIRHKVDGKPAPGTLYQRREGQWVGERVPESVHIVRPPSPGARRLAGKLNVGVQQDMNHPPKVVASDGTNEVTLTDVDPALESVFIAQSREFTWTEKDSKIARGGLLLPRDAVGPLPLVIQAYSYNPLRFSPDGPQPGTAFAAQSFVANGFAVLNINLPTEDDMAIGNSRAELERFGHRIDAAVDALASDGIVDEKRIGLVGFSRGGFLTQYAVSHPGRHSLAAAIIDDAFPSDFVGYLLMRHLGVNRISHEGAYGGSFWENQAGWLEAEPLFNAHRVRTPVLFMTHKQSYCFGLLPAIMSAYSLNRKPYEAVVFPFASHALERPRQRVAAQEISMEWMAFWLKGDAPKDRDRATYWTILRKQQDEVLKTPPPPRGKWVFQPDPVQPEWHPPAEPKKELEPASTGKN